MRRGMKLYSSYMCIWAVSHELSAGYEIGIWFGFLRRLWGVLGIWMGERPPPPHLLIYCFLPFLNQQAIYPIYNDIWVLDMYVENNILNLWILRIDISHGIWHYFNKVYFETSTVSPTLWLYFWIPTK